MIPDISPSHQVIIGFLLMILGSFVSAIALMTYPKIITRRNKKDVAHVLEKMEAGESFTIECTYPVLLNMLSNHPFAVSTPEANGQRIIHWSKKDNLGGKTKYVVQGMITKASAPNNKVILYGFFNKISVSVNGYNGYPFSFQHNFTSLNPKKEPNFFSEVGVYVGIGVFGVPGIIILFVALTSWLTSFN